MKLGIGTAMSKSPGAATFETGPAYEYSFAIDFSLVPVSDINVNPSTATGFPRIGNTSRMLHTAAADVKTATGIRLENGGSDASDQKIATVGWPSLHGGEGTDLDDSLIKPTFTSYSQNGIPANSISTKFRFVSLVMTYHTTNSGDAASANYNDEGYMRIEDADGKQYGWTGFGGGAGRAGTGHNAPRYINGVDILSDVGHGSALRDSDSGMLKSGTSEFDKPMTFTWDMYDTRAVSAGAYEYIAFDSSSAAIDPAELDYFLSADPDSALQSVTFHGIIISDSVPGEVTLPVHTSRPAAGFA